MKRLVICFILAFIALSTFAQNKPIWVKKTPKPSNNDFYYQPIRGYGDTYDKALKNATQHVKQHIHDAFVMDETEVITVDGEKIYVSIDGQTFQWPTKRICDQQMSDDEWLFLYQIANKGILNPKYDNFDCNEIDKHDLHKIDRNAMLLSLIPGGGWGELYKGQKWGWGVVGAEVLLAGGGLACYFIGQRQQQIKNDNLNNISAYDAADKTYNTVTELQPWLYGGAIGVHVLNLIVAYCIEDKCDKRINKSFTFVPTLMPSDKDLAWGIGINYKF